MQLSTVGALQRAMNSRAARSLPAVPRRIGIGSMIQRASVASARCRSSGGVRSEERLATHSHPKRVRLALTASPALSSTANLILEASLFDTPTAHAFWEGCPHHSIPLEHYGAECYGPLRVSLPVTKPQPLIPPGGLAYSSTGNFVCVFYGQDPAWDVDYIGQIEDWGGLRAGGWTTLSVVQADDAVEKM